MLILVLVIVAAAALAYANGANDTVKGAATLYGSDTLRYRGMLLFAVAATVLGSAVSLILAQALVTAFSGKGLLPAEVVSTGAIVAAVGLGAGVTILIATRLGMPTSTTHALIGALIGTGLVAGGVNWNQLAGTFVLPLLFSPVAAVVIAALVYPPLSFVRRRLGITSQTCLCVGPGEPAIAVPAPAVAPAAAAVNTSAAAAVTDSTARLPATPSLPQISVGSSAARCVTRYGGSLVGINAQQAVGAVHVLSAGSVCFARAVNDTPKIAALLITGAALGAPPALVLVTVAMAMGGLWHSRRVAETLSRKITPMNPGQGLVANLTTAGLVLGASSLGLPVSTTHVSTGAIFGTGLVRGTCRSRTLAAIGLTWLVTLPAAALLGAGLYALIR